LLTEVDNARGERRRVAAEVVFAWLGTFEKSFLLFCELLVFRYLDQPTARILLLTAGKAMAILCDRSHGFAISSVRATR